MGNVKVEFSWIANKKVEVISEVNDEDKVTVLEMDVDGLFKDTEKDCRNIVAKYISKVMDMMRSDMCGSQ